MRQVATIHDQLGNFMTTLGCSEYNKAALAYTVPLRIVQYQLIAGLELYSLAYPDTEYLRPALTVPVEAYKQAFNEWKQKEAQTV